LENTYLKYLKIISWIGGIYEICFGFMMIFYVVPLLNLLGLNIIRLQYPIFAHTAGLLAITLGLILFCSSFNVEKYLLNILLIIVLRFTIQLVLITNSLIIPSMTIGLLIFGLIDLVFAIISIFSIKKSNLTFNIFTMIKKGET
jgi:hypothetical protein